MSSVHLDGSPRVLRLKMAAHSAARRLRWISQPDRFPAPQRGVFASCTHEIYSAKIPLFRTDSAADLQLEHGKATNVRLAASKIHDLQISRNRSFSFWRTVGRLRREDGYVAGLEIHGGCLVPSIGGGVCLLSNALFEMAVRLGWIIHERHGHSKEAVPPQGPLWGLDATVLYPYVDLRFAPRHGTVQIQAEVSSGHLHLTALSDQPARERVELIQRDSAVVGGIRTGTVVRRRLTVPGDRCVGEEVVAQSRRQIMEVKEQARTCITCDETTCPSRERFLERLQ